MRAAEADEPDERDQPARRDRRGRHRGTSVPGPRHRPRDPRAPARRRRHASPGRREASRRAPCRAAGFALDTIRSLGLKGKSPVALARGRGDAAALRRRRDGRHRPPAAARRHRCRRLQLGTDRGRRLAAPRAGAAARAERTARPHQPSRGPCRARHRPDLRADLGALRREELRQREPGSPPVPAHRARAIGGEEGAHLWRLPGRARDQHGRGRGSIAAGAGHASSAGHAPDRRARPRDGARRAGSRRACRPRRALPRPHGRGDERGERDRLPRRLDDAGRDRRRRPGGDPRAAADRDRRSPTQERRGAVERRRRGPARAARADRGHAGLAHPRPARRRAAAERSSPPPSSASPVPMRRG